MGGAIVGKRQPWRPLIEVNSIDAGANNAMFDAFGIFNANFIA
jgi:hypothetical protein